MTRKNVSLTFDTDLEIIASGRVVSGYINNASGGHSETCPPEVEDLHVELIFGNTRIDITKQLNSRDIDSICEQMIEEASHD